MNLHVLILVSFAIISVKPITFYFNLPNTESKCFGEFFTEGSNAIFKINSTLKETRVFIYSPNGNILYNKDSDYSFKIALTTVEGGNHQICIENFNHENESKINFVMLTGIAARDYSNVARKKKLKPLEINLLKLEDEGNRLVHDLTYIFDHDKKNDSSERLINNIVFFSISILLIVVGIGLVELLYLNQYIQNKKKI